MNESKKSERKSQKYEKKAKELEKLLSSKYLSDCKSEMTKEEIENLIGKEEKSMLIIQIQKMNKEKISI
jgi:hypothetical protein